MATEVKEKTIPSLINTEAVAVQGTIGNSSYILGQLTESLQKIQQEAAKSKIQKSNPDIPPGSLFSGIKDVAPGVPLDRPSTQQLGRAMDTLVNMSRGSRNPLKPDRIREIQNRFTDSVSQNLKKQEEISPVSQVLSANPDTKPITAILKTYPAKPVDLPHRPPQPPPEISRPAAPAAISAPAEWKPPTSSPEANKANPSHSTPAPHHFTPARIETPPSPAFHPASPTPDLHPVQLPYREPTKAVTPDAQLKEEAEHIRRQVAMPGADIQVEEETANYTEKGRVRVYSVKVGVPSDEQLNTSVTYYDPKLPKIVGINHPLVPLLNETWTQCARTGAIIETRKTIAERLKTDPTLQKETGIGLSQFEKETVELAKRLLELSIETGNAAISVLPVTVDEAMLIALGTTRMFDATSVMDILPDNFIRNNFK